MSRFSILIHCHAALVFLLLLASPANAQRRQPVASNDEQWNLIEKGRELNDNQEFDSAIARYNQVLKLNPDNVDAMFDLVASYYDKGDSKRSLEAARRGVEYDSEHLSYFYLMIGTNHDLLKQPQKAMEAYKDGLAVEPDSYLLHYNLAVTYLNLKRPADARESFKHALIANPNHASSHIGLGQAYFRQGERVPALLALCRAIILEPESGRAETSIALIGDLLRPGEGVQPAEKENISEGNFASIDSLLISNSGLETGSLTGGWTGSPEQVSARLERLVAQLGTLDTATLGRGFAAEFYAPYFRELVLRGYGESFIHYIQQVRGGEQTAQWMMNNEIKVREFLAWSQAFKWE